MNINIPFDYNEESKNLVKLSSLYFDKVNVICSFRFDDELFSQFYNADSIEPFKKYKNIITIEEKETFPSDYLTEVSNVAYERLSRPDINHDYNKLFNEFGIEITSKVFVFTLSRIKCLVDLICSKENVISDIELIDSALVFMRRNEYENRRKSIPTENNIALNALSIFIPNVQQMEIEDILELRYKLCDELSEMRYYIDNLTNEFSVDNITPDKIKFYLEKMINPSIKQLERKVSGLRMSTLQKFIHSFKDPKTYVPLLTTFFANIPTHIALAVSAGLITTDTALEYKKQVNEIKNDPLYFALKLKKHGN